MTPVGDDELLTPAHLDAARRARDAMALCDRCLGRLFARVQHGLGNPNRGEMLRDALDLAEVPVAECALCQGLFDEAPHLATVVAEALEPYEFDTFLLGSRVDRDLEEREAELRDALGVPEEQTEPMHTELNRVVGKLLHDRHGWEVEFKRPDVTAILDARFDVVEVQSSALFIYGRYRKLERGIPQTKWPCRRCRGVGCDWCDRTGKKYPTSVEELVAAVPLERAGAGDESFHGAGREDVDALMLGTGRPFVLELKEPKRRSLDLEALEAAVNAHGGGRVEVEGLRWSSKDEVVALKESRGDKTYRAQVAFAAPVERAKLLKAIDSLRGCAIAQRTPSRVAHRRADKVRERRVHNLELDEFDEMAAALRVEGDAGLYIKELISGDEGRTRPSLSELVDTPAEVTALDVVDVEYEPPQGGEA